MLIERYVTREIIKPFLAGLGLLLVIFIAFSAAIKLSDALSGQLTVAAVIELIVLNTLIATEVLIPTTLYLAILYALGRMHRDSEMAALAAAGVGEGRILRAALMLGVLASLVVASLSIVGRPWAYARSYTLEQDTISRFDLSQIQPGRFIDLSTDGYVLHARDVDSEQRVLRDVFLHRRQGDRNEVISATEARINDSSVDGTRVVEFSNGHAYLIDRRNSRDLTQQFNTMLISFPEPERVTRFRRKAIDTATLRESELAKDIAEYQWRISTPLATLLLAMLAVPLSRTHPRQSRFSTFAIALLAYLMLFTCTGMVRNWVEDERIPANPGLFIAYLPAALLLVILVVKPGRVIAGWRR